MMPNRMNLVEVQILQVRKADQIVDADFDEPAGPRVYGNAQGRPITVKCQVAQGGQPWRQLSPTQTGDARPTSGHLTFRIADLEAQGITLNKGDLIVKIANLATNLRITHVRPQAVLGGNFLLMLVYYEENKHTQGAV